MLLKWYVASFFIAMYALIEGFQTTFTIEPLSETIDFASSGRTARWVVGTGQKIYWKESFIQVYKTGNPDHRIAVYDVCDGQATVPVGLDFYIGGSKGRVILEREEEC